MSLKDIKTKIKSVNRTRQVTKAMEAVSAVKMRKSQARALSGRPYATTALSLLERLGPALKALKHPLTETRPVRRSAVIVVTSDKGLCGVLNVGVLKSCDAVPIAESISYGVLKDHIDIFAFGKKSAEYYERRGFPIRERFENVSDDVAIADVASLAARLITAYTEGVYDRVSIVFMNFYSTFEQRPVIYQVLPLQAETVGLMVRGIVPARGAAAPTPSASAVRRYTVEPSEEAVLQELIPRLVSVMIYHALLESKASEHSARMVAMKNASDKSKELSRSLNRTFNKARQAAITREVSEIVGGIEAMATS